MRFRKSGVATKKSPRPRGKGGRGGTKRTKKKGQKLAT